MPDSRAFSNSSDQFQPLHTLVRGGGGGWRLHRAADDAGRTAAAQHVGVVDAVAARQSLPPRKRGAEATRVIILSPVFARPGARPRSRWLWTSWDRPRRRARVAGRNQPGIGHQAVIVRRRFGCGRGGSVAASVGRSFSGVGFLFQNHYPRSAGAPSYRFRSLTRRPPSVDSGLRLILQSQI